MQPVLNIDDVKRVEVALTRAGVSVSELMHRAGFAAAREAIELGDVDNVVVLVGLGNNGGDGWVAAEALHGRGVNVRVVSPIDPDSLTGDLAHQVALSAVRAGVPVTVGPSRDELSELLATADVVLDCMLGTGFRGEAARSGLPLTFGSNASTRAPRAWSRWTFRADSLRRRAVPWVPAWSRT